MAHCVMFDQKGKKSVEFCILAFGEEIIGFV